jgi:hypothetical protein
MCGEKGRGGDIRRYAVACESVSAAANSARNCAGLVTGELAHICALSFKSCITGRSSAPGKFKLASSVLPMDVRLRQPLGD